MYIRPLTKGMKDLLVELAARERNQLSPLPMHTQRHAKGLVIRNLVSLTEHPAGDDKTITSIQLNDTGWNYLLEKVD